VPINPLTTVPIITLYVVALLPFLMLDVMCVLVAMILLMVVLGEADSNKERNGEGRNSNRSADLHRQYLSQASTQQSAGVLDKPNQLTVAATWIVAERSVCGAEISLSAPSHLVKEWVGHSNLSTTSRYTHFQDDSRRKIESQVALYQPTAA
jgi:hypothetical protein